MAKKLTSLFILTLVAVAILALNIEARVNDPGADRVQQYSFMNKTRISQEDGNYTTTKGSGSPVSLGSYASDGGSPGYIVARSYRDDQAHWNTGRMIDWRVDSKIHMAVTGQACGGQTNPDACARWYHYNMYNPSTGTFVAGATGVYIQSNPLLKGGFYTQLEVDEYGNAIVTGETVDATLGADALRRVETYYDIGAATFIGDTLPGELTGLDDINFKYPRMAYQEYGGQFITHIVELEGVGAIEDTREVTYWRGVNTASGTGATWTTMMVTDSIWSNGYDIAAARDNSGEFAIAWVQWRDPYDVKDWGGYIFVLRSHDAGFSFDPVFNIIDWVQTEDSWQPWIECNTLIDSDGALHIVWNTNKYSATSQAASGINPSRMFHWSDHGGGSVEGGTISTVTITDWDLNQLCGAGNYNVFNIAKPMISECDSRLYTLWQQYGDPDFGDTADCADQSLIDYRGSYNADIFMSVSSSLDGFLWDAPRNLTNSKSPDCDTVDGGNCDSDIYPTMSRMGMNTGDFSPTVWSAVKDDGSMGRRHAFAVRDELAPGFSDDGYFLDVLYVNDLFPAIARYDSEIWTNNPIKWFRLPCVPPVIEPRIYISQDDFLHPVDWVKSGQSEELDLTIENIGNADLHVTSIAPTYHEGGSSWLTIAPTTTTIPPVSSDVIALTINPGGTINPPAGTAVAIHADVVITSDDPNRGTIEFVINTVVADTVTPPTWDTISTGMDMALTMANQGGIGNVGIGKVNLDFAGSGDDCDSTQTVYLYDGCPIVMYDAANYSWGPFWTADRAETHNFQAIPNQGYPTTKKDLTNFQQYQSGTFVNADSTLGMVKQWVAPTDAVSWVIERWSIYSFDALPHTAALGEWIDWDIPSDTGSNNEGSFVADPGSVDYLYMRGLEYLEDTACLNSDVRLGASGLLGYYTESEYVSDDAVNHTGMYGGKVCLDDDLFADGADDTFLPDSAWALLNTNSLSANNSEAEDQQIVLSFGQHTIPADDTLHIWVVHVSIYDGDETDLQAAIDAAEAWYLANRAEVVWLSKGCCGEFTGGYTGNANCDVEGKRNLADISKLIDRVYLSKAALCCEANGNVNGDIEDKINLADISKLIDHVYLSKAETAPCP